MGATDRKCYPDSPDIAGGTAGTEREPKVVVQCKSGSPPSTYLPEKNPCTSFSIHCDLHRVDNCVGRIGYPKRLLRSGTETLRSSLRDRCRAMLLRIMKMSKALTAAPLRFEAPLRGFPLIKVFRGESYARAPHYRWSAFTYSYSFIPKKSLARPDRTKPCLS